MVSEFRWMLRFCPLVSGSLLALATFLLAGCQQRNEQVHQPADASEDPVAVGQSETQEETEMFSSPLRRAITRGLKPGGNLADELRALDNYSIRSAKDANAVCDALKTLPANPSTGKNQFSSPFRALTSLFQDVESRDAPAFDVLYGEGLPQLIRIFDARLESGTEEDPDDLLFALKILAMFGSREGAEKVVEAARRPLNPDAYMWHIILAMFSEGHPHRDYVFSELSDPLPTGFLAISFLDSANSSAIEGNLPKHPFDSKEGWKQLRHWLVDSDSDHASYAHSATAALPFISNPARDQLLAIAMEHADNSVQMEAAWAAGKLGREAGLKVLARFCLDVNHSDVAQSYLVELGREDLVPAEAKESSFQARAEFARWLAHPNELGRPPDELEIVDQRLLAWPPERKPKPFWLIKYRIRDQSGLENDDVDCGLVGSATWCFFSYKMDQRPPEDVYAIHCYWEMEHADLIDENQVTDATEYAELLKQWKGAPLDSAIIRRVAEVAPKLKIPARLVALASARQGDQDGWVVLDGPRSSWYPKAEQPDETYESVILKIHVGRQLLGFQEQPDRKKYLKTAAPSRLPQEFIASYDKLLGEVSGATPRRLDELMGMGSLLARHFDQYVDALVEVEGSNKPDVVIRVYERFLDLASQTDGATREKACDSHSVLGQNFNHYVDALVSRDRSEDVVAAIEFFTPCWDHNLGFGMLGNAAHKAGKREIAEPFFLKLREGLDDYCRSEEMSLLAEIWHDRGEIEEARELLVDCIRKLVIEIRESKYNSDREMFADRFRHHRSTFLRLVPDGDKVLAELGIPKEPL